mmetsp:Transcript_51960/g.134395  ORF Transcript_51960/g.134395 Transcript_51960/m.134395 type:complete len:448 (-) Transcript_51960:38-1381(-)
MGLDSQQLFALGRSLEFHATCDELVERQAAGAVFIDHPEELGGIGERQFELSHAHLHLGLLASFQELIQVQRVAAVLVPGSEDLLDALQLRPPGPVFTELEALFVILGGGQHELHDDAYHNVHDAEGRDQQEEDPECCHVPLIRDRVPSDLRRPTVERHGLQQRVHAAANGSEVLLVVPSSAQLSVGAVGIGVVPNLLRQEHGADVNEDRRQNHRPSDGLEGLNQTLHDEPQLLEGLVPPNQPGKTHKAGYTDERYHPDGPHAHGGERGDECEQGYHGDHKCDNVPHIPDDPLATVVVDLEENLDEEHNAEQCLQQNPPNLSACGIGEIDLQADDDGVKDYEDAHRDVECRFVDPVLSGVILVLLRNSSVHADDRGHLTHLLILCRFRDSLAHQRHDPSLGLDQHRPDAIDLVLIRDISLHEVAALRGEGLSLRHPPRHPGVPILHV